MAPGFDNLKVDQRDLLARFGISVKEVEFDEVIQRSQALSREELSSAAAALRAGVTRTDSGLEDAYNKSAAVYGAIEQIVKENRLDAIALSCWSRFQETLQIAVCGVVGALNGAGVVAACEGDLTSAVSMLALAYLNQSAVVTLMDLVTIDDSDDSLLLWHCGPSAPQLADERGTYVRSLWLFENGENKKVGLANDLVLAPGEATILGFTPDFERVLVLDGTLDNQKPGYRGSRAWMRNFHLNGSAASLRDVIDTILTSGYQHHYPLAFGNCSAAVLELAAWSGIQPIAAQRYHDALLPEKFL